MAKKNRTTKVKRKVTRKPAKAAVRRPKARTRMAPIARTGTGKVRLPSPSTIPGQVLAIVGRTRSAIDMDTIMTRASADVTDRRNWTWQAKLLCEKGLLTRGINDAGDLVYSNSALAPDASVKAKKRTKRK